MRARNALECGSLLPLSEFYKAVASYRTPKREFAKLFSPPYQGGAGGVKRVAASKLF